MKKVVEQIFPVENGRAKSSSSTLHILGAGSIGLLFASSIRRKFPNKDVRLLLKPHHQRRLIPIAHNKNVKGITGDINMNDSNKYISCVVFSSKHSDNSKINHYDAISIPIRAEIIPNSTKNDTKLNSGNFTNEKKIDNLLLCTKAQDCLAAVSSISNRLAKNARIIILSNGALAIKDQLKHHFSFLYSSSVSTTSSETIDATAKVLANHLAPSLLLASTTHGAYRVYDSYQMGNNDSSTNNSLSKEDYDGKSQHLLTSQYQVKHAGIGDTFVQDDENIAQLFYLSELSHHSHSFDESQICILLWKKLAANCAINPLTALHRITNGDLLSENTIQSKILDDRYIDHTANKEGEESLEIGNFSAIIQQIIEEVSAVALAHYYANINTSSNTANSKNDHEKNNIHTSSTENEANFSNNDDDLKQLQVSHLAAFVHNVIQQTSQNQSSMLQDVLSNRKTEIDYLNGYICHLGEVYGIPTPQNKCLCVAIEKLVQSYSG